MLVIAEGFLGDEVAGEQRSEEGGELADGGDERPGGPRAGRDRQRVVGVGVTVEDARGPACGETVKGGVVAGGEVGGSQSEWSGDPVVEGGVEVGAVELLDELAEQDVVGVGVGEALVRLTRRDAVDVAENLVRSELTGRVGEGVIDCDVDVGVV